MVKIFSEEQARALINLQQRYQVWMEVERAYRALPYDLRRKQVDGRAYLYEIADRSGNGRSLGSWSEALAEQFEKYRTQKVALQAAIDTARAPLEESGRLLRALRVPMLANAAGAILREADRRRLLDGMLLVVGTNAMAAYAVEAGGRIDAPDETEDFDLAWAASRPVAEPAIGPLLKAIDSTYTVNAERSFQARNAKAYEVELLVAPSLKDMLPRRDWPQPVALPEQEWLLLGRPVDRVAICRDGSPARIVAPDPRWFGLQKMWMAAQPKRDALKRPKDRMQGLALLNAVWTAMPHYPLDDAFEHELPPELLMAHAEWRRQRPERLNADW